MAEECYTFTQARARLEEIVVQVRKKDTSLEKSLDLLEEGVRLANECTELSDHTEWRAVATEQETLAGDEASGRDEAVARDAETQGDQTGEALDPALDDADGGARVDDGESDTLA